MKEGFNRIKCDCCCKTIDKKDINNSHVDLCNFSMSVDMVYTKSQGKTFLKTMDFCNECFYKIQNVLKKELGLKILPDEHELHEKDETGSYLTVEQNRSKHVFSSIEDFNKNYGK